MVFKRAVITKPTNKQLETQMQCRLLSLGNCSIEWKRYYALQVWGIDFYQLKWTGQSLATYLDRLVSRAAAFKPKVLYELTTALFMGEFSFRTFRNGTLRYLPPPRSNYIDMVCLNSTYLRIDCSWRAGNKLTWVNFTFRVNVTRKIVAPLSLNISLDSWNQYAWHRFFNGLVNMIIKISDFKLIYFFYVKRSIAKDQKGRNLFQLFAYEKTYLETMGYHQTYMDIYEFNTNTHMTIYSDGLMFLAPQTLLLDSTGIFIDGYTDLDNIEVARRRRKRELVNESEEKEEEDERKCLIKCSRVDHFLKSRRASGLVSFKQAKDKCTLDCIMMPGKIST